MKKLVQKIKDTLSILSSSKGFTLLELLVVVLIIGILAAIALPQYKMAVAKSKFNTVKSRAKTVGEAIQRYYLVDNVMPRKLSDLDIDFPGYEVGYVDSHGYHFSTSEGISCGIMNTSDYVTCSTLVSGKEVVYYMKIATNKPYLCVAFSKDHSDTPNRLCQLETGENGGNYGNYYAYSY